ncbi:MAG: hypothetical protein LUD52_03470 [Opitutae bacterium]|nr:hypothetical protein [Opitutae bacterium]
MRAKTLAKIVENAGKGNRILALPQNAHASACRAVFSRGKTRLSRRENLFCAKANAD